MILFPTCNEASRNMKLQIYILGKYFPSTWKVIWTDNGSNKQALNNMNNISFEKNEFRRCICPSIYAFGAILVNNKLIHI